MSHLSLPRQVWLAEWTGCQVAVKELISFANNEDENARAWQDMQNEVWTV